MSNLSILIVEDEAIIAADIASKLLRLGYAVAGSTDAGEEAVNLARRLRPSLVLMDIRLAGAMDGIEAADAIRRECQLPVVFLSAHTDKSTVQLARQAEAYGFIMKPFENRELHTQIEMALYKHAAEQRLQESESRLREVLENSLDASYKRNLQTKSYDYLSPVFARITGFPPDEMNTLSAETINALVHPDDRTEVERVISESMSGADGQANHMEYRFRHKKGHYVWLHNQFTIMRDAGGQPLASIGIVRDITDHKQSEQKLIESEAKYRSQSNLMRLMCDSVPDMIWAKDLEKRYIFANKALCRHLLNAADTNEPIGKTTMFFTERERSRHMDNPEWHTLGEICGNTDTLTMAAGTPQQFDEFGNVQGKFLFLDMHKAPFMDQNGKMIGTVGSARDVTKAKEMEQRLNQSEAQMRAITDSVRDGILMMDQNGLVSFWNPAAERIFGYPGEEAVGKNLHGLIAPQQHQEAHQAAFGGFQQTGQGNAIDATIELGARHKDGHEITVELSLSRLRIHDGWHTIGIIRDITDRKRDETNKARVEAQNMQLQKAESLGRMAGAIAHHFNNNFHVLMGNLEMAMDGLSLGADPKESLVSAMQAAHKAAEVSSLMLTYLGQLPGKRETIDLTEACRQNLTLLQAAVPKGTIIKADFPTNGPAIHANTGQIQHILINLLTNAWESSDECRCIGLAVKTVFLADMTASMRFPIDWQPVNAAYACLEVTDTGCGIAEKDFEKIFDPFFSTKFTGRGLGLSVVLGIARAHHGAVTVESKPGAGSVFRVFFPLSAEEVLHLPDKAVQASKNEEFGTVLLAEDEEMVREITADMLRSTGFRVIEAKDGVDAVKAFRRHQKEIRCIVCDLTMPRMDGWETLSAIRSLSPGIPFVLSSGYDKEQTMAGDHAEWPQAFLGKPYLLQELRDAIHQSLNPAHHHGNPG